ncbi:MAG: serine hydrolase domain-containing protein [Nocardioidaceae bacterium]
MVTPGDPLQRHASATAGNWQQAPYNRWAFWHLRELLPTQRVSRGAGPVRVLPDRADVHDVLGVEVSRHDGCRVTVADVLEETHTDAFAVAQDGVLVAEGYAPTGGPTQPHVVMSVTKSVVGCVAAILTDRGVLDPERDVAAYVPELAQTGFAGATVQQLLDMRSGVRFREDYANPRADVRRLDKWIMPVPPRAGDRPRGLYNFLTTLRQEAPHGSRFLYRSAETDALGWVCERAGEARMADLIASLVWGPLGAEQDAELLCDGLGTAVHNGGLATTARDLLRFGQMLLDGGAVPDGAAGSRQVVPAAWLRSAWAVDADVRSTFRASLAEPSFPGGWYRNQFWFRPGEHGDVLLALGIHGQMLHVSRRTRTVCVKFSGWPEAQHPVHLQDTLRAFDAVGGALLEQAARADVPHLPGVVSGMHRSGAASLRGRG